MADLSKPVIYRELNVNGVTQNLRVLDGIATEAFDYSAAAGVGYMEKRAASDGMYASDVYLGAREVTIRGHVHAPTQPEMFDYLHIVRAVFAPTGAYAASPGDRGFLPLYFDQPTADLSSFPGGSQNLFINCRPLELVKFSVVRDNTGGDPDLPNAIPWSARLIAKDPRIYVYPEQYKTLNGPPVLVQQSPPLDAINRGDYESPLNIMLVVGTISAAHDFVLRGFGGVTMTIKIENKPNVIYRYYGEDRLLMTQDRLDSTAPEALRMDLLVWNSKNRYPAAPAAINPTLRPFKTTWTYTCGANLQAGSRLWWNEAFA